MFGVKSSAYDWQDSINDEDFKQWVAYLEGNDAINIKVRATVDGT